MTPVRRTRPNPKRTVTTHPVGCVVTVARGKQLRGAKELELQDAGEPLGVLPRPGLAEIHHGRDRGRSAQDHWQDPRDPGQARLVTESSRYEDDPAEHSD